MKQKLFIHSGAYKTATSAVQVTLNNNAETLLREHDLLVPKSFARPLQGVDGAGAKSHNQLAHAINKSNRGDPGARERLESGLATLAGEIRKSGAPCAVISSEMLTSIDVPSATLVCDALREFDVRIIYTLRKINEYLESLARQRLKFKNSANKLPPPYQSPFTGLLSWASVLGDSAISAFLYGYPSRDDSVLNVLRTMGIPDAENLLGGQAMRNPSLHADGLLLRKVLTRFATRTGFDVVSGALREPIVRIAYDKEAKIEQHKALQMYSKAEHLAIFDATLATHEEIAKRFLGPEEAAIFLSRRDVEAITDTDPPRWDQAEILAMVNELAKFARESLHASKDHGQALSELQGELHRAREQNTKLKRRLKRLRKRPGNE